MRITMTTPSEPTGILPIESDVAFRTKGLYKTVVVPITMKGKQWVVDNMDTRYSDFVVVDADFEDELKGLMEKDGLRVLER